MFLSYFRPHLSIARERLFRSLWFHFRNRRSWFFLPKDRIWELRGSVILYVKRTYPNYYPHIYLRTFLIVMQLTATWLMLKHSSAAVQYRDLFSGFTPGFFCKGFPRLGADVISAVCLFMGVITSLMTFLGESKLCNQLLCIFFV